MIQNNPFATLPVTPVEHFKRYFYAAVLHVIEQVSISFGSHEAALKQFPFLEGYYDEIRGQCPAEIASEKLIGWWREALCAWEESATCHLPIQALRQSSALGYTTITLLLAVGLIEEDARFGQIFETIQGLPGQHRPTLGLFNAWWREPSDNHDVRAILRRLQEAGLVQVINPDAPRIEWALQSPALLWDVLRGEAHEELTSWARYRPPQQLLPCDELILPAELKTLLESMPALFATGEIQMLAVRGLQHNGRRTLLGAVARMLGRGLLEVRAPRQRDDERWRLIGSLATLLHALPTLVLDLAPGESTELPSFPSYTGPIGVVLGKQGGLQGASAERTLALTLEMPDVEKRKQHWLCCFGEHEIESLESISACLRMSGGNIRRIAKLAQSYTTLDKRSTVTFADVRQASRALNRQGLETLATHIEAVGDWSQLASGAETQRELLNLESRCRHREHLSSAVGVALTNSLNTGVRALFSGPSGTGKTLAARMLAAVLQMDLYRLDLSAVVNKYIGETEKNLNQVFARAEELGVILLLDEGDALLTKRTNVQNANDRYANLETNYLLQRIESFEGILIVTTNAGDRIDSAFQRRMDVVVAFRPPDIAERWTIWQLHLPAEHAIDLPLLQEVASRCTLTGGQIRNAALHAALLSLNDEGKITSAHLEEAVQREYRKLGATYPLRRLSPTHEKRR